jgi:Protein of unknown function (DUF4236)
MGFYLRKSVRVGPLRFNLSGSGIGVSCGIPGLRVGTGPRGNYIHAGRGGIYYRKTFSTKRPRCPGIAEPVPGPISPAASLDPTLAQFEAVDAGTSVNMQDASSQALLDELNEKRRRLRLCPWLLLAGIAALSGLLYERCPAPMIGVAGSVIAIAVVLAAYRDTVKKTAVLMYDFDDEVLGAYANLDAALTAANASQRIWHVQTKAAVLDRKYHAGSASVIETDNVRLSKSAPPGVKTNILPIAIPLGHKTLYFFPDRVLVLDAIGFGAINYQNVRLALENSRFVTGDLTAPSDARVIDYTWRYVNKGGGPDQRFRDNPPLPVIETSDVTFSSDLGFSGQLKFSNTGAAQALVEAIRQFVAVAFQGTPNEASSPAYGQTPLVVPPSNKDIPRRPPFRSIAAIAAIVFVGIAVVVVVSNQPLSSTNSKKTSMQDVRPGENVSASPTPISLSSPSASYSPITVRRALPVESATVAPPPSAGTYRVVNVAPNDFLYARGGPGSTYPIVVRIRGGTRGISLGVSRVRNGSTTWRKISVGPYTGWVNEIYIAVESEPEIRKAKPVPLQEQSQPVTRRAQPLPNDETHS